MANTLDNLLPKIIARGLLALRRNALITQLVNMDYGTEAAQKGDVINVPGPVSGSVRDVTPAPTKGSVQDMTPGNLQIALDQWKEFPFYLTDKDRVQIDASKDFMPMTLSEAFNQLANTADSHVAGKYTGVYGFTGTAGTTPFASTGADAVNARTLLNKQLAPMNDRRIILNPDAEGAALQVSALADLEKTGDAAVKIQGMLGVKYGFQWGMSQSITSHTAGTASVVVAQASIAVGASAITVNASIPGTILVGDIFTIAGSSQTYVSLTSANLTSTATASINIRPAVVSTIAAGAAITIKGSHVVNLAFQRGAFTYASRPLQSANDDASQLGSKIMEATDPVTGLSLRLEVSRQHKQTEWSLDHLYGGELVRPQFAVRIAG